MRWAAFPLCLVALSSAAQQGAPPPAHASTPAAVDEQVRTVSTVYPNAALSRGEEYWGYANGELSARWDPLDRYEVVSYLGDGTNSVVLEAVDIVEEQEVALKVLRPTTVKRIKREVRAMQVLGGQHGALALLAMCRDPSSGATTLVLERAPKGSGWLAHGAWPTPLSSLEVRHFMYQLLRALDHCHRAGVMHRDIKPGNVLIDRSTGTLRLVDWGLADFYLPGKRFATRVGTRAYKAPEILAGYRFYDYSVDIFSAGCVLAGLIFQREPFFAGSNDDDQLRYISTVLGTSGLVAFCDKYNIDLGPELWASIGSHPQRPWSSFVSPEALEGGDTKQIFSLLDRMLCYDHQERATAREAMSHPFFDPVRGEEGMQQCPPAPPPPPPRPPPPRPPPP